MKKVSVVIPAYNHDLYIEQAIESVLSSSYPNIELIVIDDGSNDQTRDKVMEFEKVKYYYQENSGAFSAINDGISRATGDYLAILNDDDRYMKDHIDSAIKNMENFGNDLFIGRPNLIGFGAKLNNLQEHIVQSDLQIGRLGYADSLFQINWSLSTSAFVFSRDLSNKLGGFQNFAMCHDLDFLIRALAIENCGVGTSRVPSWEYRCHETNSGSSISLVKQHAEIIYSLGRSLDFLEFEISQASLKAKIGHGLNDKILAMAAVIKPWRSESRMSVSDCVDKWVINCIGEFEAIAHD